jgi:acetyltransferase
MAAAKKFASRKPLIAYKAGRFAQSAKAAASHTGAMAGVDAVYDAAMKRAGIVRVFDMQSLFACAELLTLHPQAIGPRLAIVTNAGGPGVMATDTLLEENGRLAELAPETIKVLDAFLPANWSRANPVDVIGDADAERISKAVTATLADPNVDTVLALLTPQAMTHPTQSARAIAAISIPPGKAILASLMGGEQIAEGRRILQQSGIPTFETPEQAIHGLMHLIDHSKRRDSLTTIVDNKPIPLAGTREERRRYVDDLAEPSTGPLSEMGTSARTLTEPESKQLLVRYGIPTTPIRIAPTASEAVQAAEELGFPVVLKILSPHISHKTDVGGVALNLATATQVRESFERMIAQARSMRPEAELLGVTVQPMIAELHGVELILGAKQDPVFGSVIMMGTGGIHAEIYRDRSLELPPIDRSLALRMLQNLRCWPLLQGYRGGKAANIDAVAELITRFSAMIVEQPRILECDLNPLVVSSSQVIVLDARFVIGNSSFSPADPYSHLAIAPEN